MQSGGRIRAEAWPPCGSAPGLTANELRRMVCTHATVHDARLAAGDGVSSLYDLCSSKCRMQRPGVRDGTLDDRSHAHSRSQLQRPRLARRVLAEHRRGGRAASPVPCRVTVVDNGSTDGSDELVASRWPSVGFVREPNHGLASFNRVLERLQEPVVLLLNNDIKLDADAVGPLLGRVRDP